MWAGQSVRSKAVYGSCLLREPEMCSTVVLEDAAQGICEETPHRASEGTKVVFVSCVLQIKCWSWNSLQMKHSFEE